MGDQDEDPTRRLAGRQQVHGLGRQAEPVDRQIEHAGQGGVAGEELGPHLWSLPRPGVVDAVLEEPDRAEGVASRRSRLRRTNADFVTLGIIVLEPAQRLLEVEEGILGSAHPYGRLGGRPTGGHRGRKVAARGRVARQLRGGSELWALSEHSGIRLVQS